MFPIILYLAFSLPSLILAYPPKFRFAVLPTGPSLLSARAPAAISAPTGDTLNRTACFCASPQWVMDQNYGYYYQFSYLNAHLNRTYVLEPVCQSTLSINIQAEYNPKDKPILQNECLRSHERDSAKFCTGKDTDGDTFCYILAGGADSDSYSFNKQHRTGLPVKPQIDYSSEVVARVCEEACKEHVGGMEMLKDDALEVLEGYYNLVGVSLRSSVVFYPSIPDMCKDCK